MRCRAGRLLCAIVLGGLCLAARTEAGPRIGLVWWPADPANPANAAVEDLEDCLAGRLPSDCPGSTIVPPATIRDALFPLLEPATQPETEEAFTILLAREDVHARLVTRIDYLVAFTGGTTEENNGGIVCGAGFGAGGCLGFAWINKNSRINVVVWDLDTARPATRQDSRVEGTTWIPAFLLPIPIPAVTEREACHDMSRQIADFVLSASPPGGGR